VFVGSRATFLHLLELVTSNELRPQIDRVFEFEDARSAFEYAKSGQQFGKVVITLG
jgi:NADPH:quinone reductase-like Zn-dependent oxidoreductase